MDIFKNLEIKSKKNLRTIIFPESDDSRVLNAVDIILKKKIAKIVLISSKEIILKSGK